MEATTFRHSVIQHCLNIFDLIYFIVTEKKNAILEEK